MKPDGVDPHPMVDLEPAANPPLGAPPIAEASEVGVRLVDARLQHASHGARLQPAECDLARNHRHEHPRER